MSPPSLPAGLARGHELVLDGALYRLTRVWPLTRRIWGHRILHTGQPVPEGFGTELPTYDLCRVARRDRSGRWHVTLEA